MELLHIKCSDIRFVLAHFINLIIFTTFSTKSDLFAFDLYDRNLDGSLGVEEIEAMVHDIYGKRSRTNTHAKA